MRHLFEIYGPRKQEAAKSCVDLLLCTHVPPKPGALPARMHNTQSITIIVRFKLLNCLLTSTNIHT